jgi:hypothetical protein
MSRSVIHRVDRTPHAAALPRRLLTDGARPSLVRYQRSRVKAPHAGVLHIPIVLSAPDQTQGLSP